MRINLVTGLLFLFTILPGYAQQPPKVTVGEQVTVFRFVPGNDMFYTPWSSNGEELNKLYTLVDKYHSEIVSGQIPVYVDGYCASGADAAKNYKMAVVRSNRVKSELITNKNLAEEHFVTKNHAAAYGGYKDVVVVTLRIPLEEKTSKPEAVVQTEPKSEPKPQAIVEDKSESKPEPVRQTEPVVQPAPVQEPVNVQTDFYCIALRTNLLYDAFLTPTLGVEWRINPNIGVKLDGSFSYWGGETGKVQKLWLINPELRWYMGVRKRFYAGASGSYGRYNIYKRMIGGMFPDDTGYQGSLWNAGLTVGYQLYLSRSFSLDFNLGLGYTRFDYDSFTVTDGVRVYTGKDQTSNFWGPTQAGVSLVWTMGGK